MELGKGREITITIKIKITITIMGTQMRPSIAPITRFKHLAFTSKEWQ